MDCSMPMSRRWQFQKVDTSAPMHVSHGPEVWEEVLTACVKDMLEDVKDGVTKQFIKPLFIK